MDQKSNFKVCVTGGEGFVGSWLIKKLLDKGYIVHTTLRPNSEDKSKVDLLKSLPGAETRLIFFEAEIYDPDTFENAIQGCDFVFHVATPLQHIDGYQYKNVVEACVGAAKKIASFCVKSGTVKRLIYTASVLCASPLKEDGSAGYKDSIDETCYTPLDHPLTCHNDYLRVRKFATDLNFPEFLKILCFYFTLRGHDDLGLTVVVRTNVSPLTEIKK